MPAQPSNGFFTRWPSQLQLSSLGKISVRRTLTLLTEKMMLMQQKKRLTKASPILIFIAKGCMPRLIQRENNLIVLFSKKEVL